MTTRFSGLIAVLALVLGGLALAVWVSASAGAQTAGSPGAGAPSAGLQGTVINVSSATDTAAIAAVIAAFEAANPSVTVNYREYNTLELYLAMLDDPTGVDVVISSAMDLQTDLVNRGMAHRFEPAAADALPDWARWRDELYGFTFEPVAMVYNRAAFADRDLPRNRSELASMIRDDPGFFEGRIGTYDIGLSGVGYMFATQDVQRGYQFSRVVESFGRADAKTYCCTVDMVEATARGDLVFAYNVIGSYAHEIAENDPRIGITLFQDYALVMTRTAFVPKVAPERQAATAFVGFLLSPEGQAAITANSALMPIVEAARGPSVRDFLVSSPSFLPVRLGPGLLTYLDTLKRAQFLQDWNSAIDGPRATP